MTKIHISQFYSCSQIDYACELLYACELGKYLHESYGDTLSLDGVILPQILKKSYVWDVFRIALDKGWVCDANISQSDISIDVQNKLYLTKDKYRNVFITTEQVDFDQDDFNKRETDDIYAVTVPQRVQVSFKKQDEDVWLWGIYGYNDKFFNTNIKTFNTAKGYQVWVSFLAYVAVERLKNGSPVTLGIIFNQQMLDSFHLVYITILDYKTNCLKGWCYYTFDNTVSELAKSTLGYFAWYFEGLDKGMLNRWYSVDEKLEYMKELDIREGDIVFVYLRQKLQEGNIVKKIDSCRLARIDKITNDNISVTYINSTKTRFHGMHDFMDKVTSIRALYEFKSPYEEINTSTANISWIDMGVGYKTYSELHFILPLDRCDDERDLWVTDGERKDHLILPQNDVVYWILKDYDFDFDDERFVTRYFKDELPLYTRYMNGEVLPEEYYIE